MNEKHVVGKISCVYNGTPLLKQVFLPFLVNVLYSHVNNEGAALPERAGL